jgi:glycosyltransferase involved in cell wall biosynthesis
VFPPQASARRADRWIDRTGERALGGLSHVVLAHDHATAERARAELGSAVAGTHVVPHGSFIDVYPAGRPRAEVRAALGIPPDAFAFLCFGQLRPDKAMDLVLEAFGGLELPGVALVVAGHLADGRSRTAIVQASREDPRIAPLVEPVPHERVAELFGAADAAVLGRGEVWTSGSLVLALSLGVPVVAARVAPHEELMGGGEAGWLFTPGDAASLRDALAAAASDREAARAKGRAARAHAERIPTWPEIAARTAALMLDGETGMPIVSPASAPARERLEIADDSA